MIRLLGDALVVVAIYASAAVFFDALVQRQEWRIGKWSRLLWLSRKTGGRCLRCKTDFRYVVPHDTPYRAEGGLCCFPLCEGCWTELDPELRLPYYGLLLKRWATTGKYDADPRGWKDDELAIFAAVKAGL